MISKRDVLAGASAMLGAAVLARAAQAAVKPAIVRVPITFTPDNKPVLSLTIGGKGPYRFVLDTGAFTSVINESIAKDLKLHSGMPIKTRSIKGDESSYVYQAQDIVIGGRLPLPRMSFVGAANFNNFGVDGLLPASFLTFLPSQLDFEAKEIRYYIGGAEMDLDGFEKLPTFFQADRDDQAEKVYAEINFDGRKLVYCVDTGAASNLFVFSGIVDRYKLWDKYPILRKGQTRGVNGEALEVRLVQGPNITFGGLKIPSMPVTLGDPKEIQDLSDNHDGLIGTPFLRHFTLAFNDKALYLKPNNSYASLTNFLPDSALPDVPAAVSPDQPAVPFLYGENRRIVVPGRIGEGPAFTCVLNTGVAASQVGAKRAAEVGLSALPSGDFDGSAITFSSIRLPKLKLADRKEAPNGNPELGLDFLTLLSTGIDFDQNQITFFIKTQPDLTGYVKLPAERKAGDGRFQVKATLNGRQITCLIHTCMQMGVLLPPGTVKAWNLWDAFPDAENRFLTSDTGQREKTRYVKVKGFDLAGLHVDVAPVTMVDPAASPSPEWGSFDAVVGMGILHRLNIVFVGGEMWVKPNSFWADGAAAQSPAPGASTPPPAS